MAKKKREVRTNFRKNRGQRARKADLTREFHRDGSADNTEASQERVSGKGELTRKRTVMVDAAESGDEGAMVLSVDESVCKAGRVLSVHGLQSVVQGDDGLMYRCATRRILKTLSTDDRHVVVAGDRVQFRPADNQEGIIERVEPRYGELSRTSKNRRQIIAGNIDQLLIIASAAEPYLKPNLIDRFLIAAEQNRIAALICINKVDLVDTAELQPLVGVYSQMGYRVLLLSATTGYGVERLRTALRNRQSAVAGQSGVGKSTLLNAVEPGLALRTATVSSETQKGRHTTTSAVLLPLAFGGYVVDTPGIRQFQLWDVVPAEVAGFYRDIRPYVSRCRFPDCTHTHEEDCSVKAAVADGWLDARRYESYCHVLAGDFVD